VYFSDEVLNILKEEYSVVSINHDQSLDGPAKYQHITGTGVTVQGKLLLCLGHEEGLDMLPILRDKHYQRQELKQAIVEAIKSKPEKHDFKPQEIEIKRFMSMTGG